MPKKGETNNPEGINQWTGKAKAAVQSAKNKASSVIHSVGLRVNGKSKVTSRPIGKPVVSQGSGQVTIPYTGPTVKVPKGYNGPAGVHTVGKPKVSQGSGVVTIPYYGTSIKVPKGDVAPFSSKLDPNFKPRKQLQNQIDAIVAVPHHIENGPRRPHTVLATDASGKTYQFDMAQHEPTFGIFRKESAPPKERKLSDRAKAFSELNGRMAAERFIDSKAGSGLTPARGMPRGPLTQAQRESIPGGMNSRFKPGFQGSVPGPVGSNRAGKAAFVEGYADQMLQVNRITSTRPDGRLQISKPRNPGQFEQVRTGNTKAIAKVYSPEYKHTLKENRRAYPADPVSHPRGR